MLRCSHCDIMLGYWPVRGNAVGPFSHRVHPAEVDLVLDELEQEVRAKGFNSSAKLFEAKLELVRSRVKFQQQLAKAAAAVATPPPVSPTVGAAPKAQAVVRPKPWPSTVS